MIKHFPWQRLQFDVFVRKQYRNYRYHIEKPISLKKNPSNEIFNEFINQCRGKGTGPFGLLAYRKFVSTGHHAAVRQVRYLAILLSKLFSKKYHTHYNILL